MVSRVFCYSKEEAKKNGNFISLKSIIWSCAALFAATIVLCIAITSEAILLMYFGIGIMILTFALMIYWAALYGYRMRARMTGYAIDINGTLYKVQAINNGSGLAFAGMGLGSLMDETLGKGSSSLGRSMGGIIGSAAQISMMNRAAQIMSHPEIISQMVEKSKDITGAQVFAIMKVDSYTENNHSIKINCDYQDLKTGKIKHNKNLKIEKSYNCLSDLFNIIRNSIHVTHR